MKVKVKSIFVDKNDMKKRYKIGEELTVSKERYEEIKDFVELVNDSKDNKPKTESQN